MNADDRQEFGLAMARLFHLYNDELTSAVLDAWWGALIKYPLREVVFGLNAHATDPQYGHRKPTLSDIVRHITETLPAKRRQMRNERVRAARERIEPLERELYRLESDLNLSLLRPEEEPEAKARINGLRMQIGAMHREAGIDDSMRIEHDAAQSLQSLAKLLPAPKEPQ